MYLFVALACRSWKENQREKENETSRRRKRKWEEAKGERREIHRKRKCKESMDSEKRGIRILLWNIPYGEQQLLLLLLHIFRKIRSESNQKSLKVGIHSFPAWRSALKRASVKIGRQVRLFCPWARYLTGLPLRFSG